MRASVRPWFLVVSCVWLLAACGLAIAEDAYFRVSIADLEILEGKLPDSRRTTNSWQQWQVDWTYVPYAFVAGEGEAYVGNETNASTDSFSAMTLAARGPAGKDLEGTCVFPNPDHRGMSALRFRIAANKATTEARTVYLMLKERRLQQLLQRGVPGAAWFRHELREAVIARTGKPPQPAPERGGLQGRRSGANLQFDEGTFDIFTGGRAVSENLQLDRALTGIQKDEKLVDVGSIEGITIAEVDWKVHMKPEAPALDPLAALLPADQHALLFRSFESMLATFDEADAQLTPLMHASQPRAEDARTAPRYKQQLCLEDTAIARLMGPQIVSAVAITGSDPYLPTGSDVAILFECKNPTALAAFMETKHRAVTDAKPQSLDLQGKTCKFVRTADRKICSYVMQLDNVVVVSNSPAQMERIVATRAKNRPSLESLAEYKFFRQRYVRGDSAETGFLVMTDSAIRRWCSAQWRIGFARRLRAAATMAELQAANLHKLLKGNVASGPIYSDLAGKELGELTLTAGGVESSIYGNLAFMTPIVELDLQKVTESEAAAYGRWRQNYQMNWRNAFDPIAARFTVHPKLLGADLTVMPLIAGTDYREFIDLTTGVALQPQAGDRHEGALLHFVMALNMQSRSVQMAEGFLKQSLRSLNFSPLSWLGTSIALWIDDDPIWREIAAEKDPQKFASERVSRLPVVLRIESRDALKLTLFLSAVRAFIEQTAPGMTRWSTIDNNGQPYVKIEPAQRGQFGAPQDFHVVYAASPESLLLSINESALKRTLARAAANAKARAEGKPIAAHPGQWIGESLALEISPAALAASQVVFSNNYRGAMQQAAWANLPILNEWRRLQPTGDAVALHEKHWQVRLTCPGNGHYVWDDHFKTYSSTVYGHPGKPLEGLPAPPVLSSAKAMRFGLTFEKDGLRARAELERK